jgi:hypothetical protein
MILAIFFALFLQSPAPHKAPAGHSAAVHGKVLADDGGAPIRYASVQLRRSGTGQETLTVSTDSAGLFEIHDIEPGTYSARAAKPGFVTTQYKGVNDDSSELKLNGGQIEEVDFRLPRSAAISGTVTDTYGEPISNANVQAMRKVYVGGRVELSSSAHAQTDDRGEYRLYNLPAGRYYVQAAKRVDAGDAGVPLSTTMFPSASRLENAQPLVVKAGEERQGVNVALQEALLFDVTGRVVDAGSGQPMNNAFLNLSPLTGGNNVSDRVQADGSFRFHNVAEGSYRIFATVASTDRTKPPVNVNRYVDLTKGNASDILIRVGPGSTVKGSVTALGGALPQDFQISLTQRAADGTFVDSFSSMAAADGSFELEHVQAGSCEVGIFRSRVPGSEKQPFFLSSAVIGTGAAAKDITDSSIDIGDSDSLELSLTIDLLTATVSGRVMSVADPAPEGAPVVADQPLAKVNVALISADPKKRLIPRYFHSTRSSRTGSFKLEGLPPGDYLLIPWPGEDAGQLLDPDIFPMVEKYATRVTLERGGKVTQEVRMTPELRTVADAFAQ